MNIQDITLEQIARAYRGKESPGKSCRCGCNGTYFEANESAHRTDVIHVLRMIQAHEGAAVVEGDVVDLALGKGRVKQVYTLYLKINPVNSISEESPEFHAFADDLTKPGCVCSKCGRTVTVKEYSSGKSSCCEEGMVIPQEDYV